MLDSVEDDREEQWFERRKIRETERELGMDVVGSDPIPMAGCLDGTTTSAQGFRSQAY